MTNEDTTARDTAVRLMRSGEATISEAAALAGVDRQLAYYWAKAAEIDVAATRRAYLEKRWAAALNRKR